MIMGLLFAELVWSAPRIRIRIGVEGCGAPMSFYDPHQAILTGFDVELAREVFFRLGLEPIFYNTYWQRIFRDLHENRIDLVWSGMTITPERQATSKISRPYHRSELMVAVLPSASIVHMEHLKNRRVGYLAGSPVPDFIRSHPILGPEYERGLLTLVPHIYVADGLLDLAFGHIDAMVVDDFDVFMFESLPLNKTPIRLLPESIGFQELGIAARPADSLLIQRIDSVLVLMEQEGEVQKLRQVWFNPVYFHRLIGHSQGKNAQ